MILTTDASLIGWGMHLHKHSAEQMVFNRIHLTHQPLRATSGLQYLLTFPISSQAVYRKSGDGQSCLHVLYQQAGRSEVPHVMHGDNQTVCNWFIQNSISVSAVYFLGHQNTTADTQSRTFSHDHKWEVDMRAYSTNGAIPP